MPTKAQVQVYELLVDIALKSALGFSAVVAFWIVLYLFIQDPSYQYAAMEGVIGWVIQRVFGHYFPKGGTSRPPR